MYGLGSRDVDAAQQAGVLKPQGEGLHSIWPFPKNCMESCYSLKQRH